MTNAELWQTSEKFADCFCRVPVEPMRFAEMDEPLPDEKEIFRLMRLSGMRP
jgi:hypothetical protein